MAFKMKGSAFKLGNVATKSTLKQTSPMKHDPNDDVQPGTQHKDWLAQADRHNKRHTAGETHNEHGDWDTKEEEPKKEEPKKDEGTLQMKSPIKQSKAYKTAGYLDEQSQATIEALKESDENRTNKSWRAVETGDIAFTDGPNQKKWDIVKKSLKGKNSERIAEILSENYGGNWTLEKDGNWRNEKKQSVKTARLSDENIIMQD